MINFKRVYYLLIFVFFVFFSGCISLSSEKIQPTAQAGILDLRVWDFREDGIVALNGEWDFFWDKFIDPDDILSEKNRETKFYNIIPANWNHYQLNERELPGYGHATYALTVLHNSAGKKLSVSIKQMSTAYTLYFDGKIICSNGKTGISRESMVPEYRPVIADYVPSKNQTDIVLHISNFNHEKGGPTHEIKIGNSNQVHHLKTKKLIINLFLIGSILTIGLYHLSLYLIVSKYKSLLYFGILCCLVSIRSCLTNERIVYYLFPGINWEILLKTEYITYYLAVPVFALYISSLFSMEFSKKILLFINFFSSIFCAIVIFSSGVIITQTLQIYQIFTILFGLYLIYVLLNAYKLKRDGSLVISIGFLILFISVLCDILSSNLFIKIDFSLQLGLFVFIFSQAFVISSKFSKTLKRVENQKGQLIESHQQFKNSRIALILGLAKLAEYRDSDTGSHLERIREYIKSLAIELSKKEEYKNYITNDYVDDLYQSVILHDIGKVGIQDSILLKPGKLTDEEFEMIKYHTILGGDALSTIESKSKVRSFLSLGKDIAYYHHEKWDGTGYPKGLKGKEIPLSARITAIADVYDALTSERPYKKAFSHKKAVGIIMADSGSHFDPDIIEAFITITNQFEQIRKQYLNDIP